MQSLSPRSPEAALAVPPELSPSDEEVVLRVRAGETQLFELLMRRYNRRLYGTVNAILHNDADAEDAVQQAYVNAYRHLGQFEGRARFSTWLTRIAVYEALARRRRAHDTPLEWNGDEQVGQAKSALPDPERQAYAGELGVLLDSALAALPPRYQSVFVLREIDGLNTTETARQLRLTEATVKTRLHRARSLLQRALSGVTSAEAGVFDGARCDRTVAAVMRRLFETDVTLPSAVRLS